VHHQFRALPRATNYPLAPLVDARTLGISSGSKRAMSDDAHLGSLTQLWKL